jgi:K(+)-stimulated pyrophosphate-energized sodium pump
VHWLGIWGSIVSGLIAGLIIAWGTEYYTSYEHAPTQRISEQAKTGPATVIIAGIAEGMISTWIPLITTVVAIICAFVFAGGGDSFLLGVFGVGIAAVGMLSTLAITLATDAYGPIADNAGGNAEMTHQDPSGPREDRHARLAGQHHRRDRQGLCHRLGGADRAGAAGAYVEEVRVGIHREVVENYVEPAPGEAYKLIVFDDADGDGKCDYGKYGLALPGGAEENNVISMFVSETGEGIPMTIAGEKMHLVPNQYFGKKAEAVLTGLAGPDIQLKKAGLQNFMSFYDVTLMNPKVLIGVFAGVLMVFVFAAMTMQAVGRAAMAMVMEVRRQFKEIPGIMEGKATPEYAKCVAISTAGAQREMIIPTLLAVGAPIAVGLVLGVGGVLGLLVGGLCCGFAVAMFMANAGGAWDNAKKLHRNRRARRQGFRCPQGGRRRRHRRGPVQGHLRPVAEHPHQADEHRLHRVRRHRGRLRPEDRRGSRPVRRLTGCHITTTPQPAAQRRGLFFARRRLRVSRSRGAGPPSPRGRRSPAPGRGPPSCTWS